MTINTIVTDMDDTLFDGEGKISQETLATMHECTARGIRLIPASGRAAASMAPFMEQLQTGQPYIGCNGAQVLDADGSLIRSVMLEAQLARDICRYLSERGFYVQVYRDECFYYAEECDPAISYKKSSGMTGVAVGDLQAFLTFDVPKVLSVNHPTEVAKWLDAANEHFKGRAVFSVSKPYFLEAEPVGASKGAALTWLSERIGIDPEHTMVFGDSLNDLSMLAFTPHSVAMGNARKEVRAAARHVCLPNTQDGLAHFVREHILNSKEVMA